MAGDYPVHDDRYLRNIFFSIVFLGVFVILFIPDSSYYGYAIVACGLFMIVLVFFEYIIRETTNAAGGQGVAESLKTFLYKLITIGTPVFMVFGIVIYLLSVSLSYNKLIVSGDVTPQYINFRTISAILLIIESVLLNRYISQKRASSMNSNGNGNSNSNSNGPKTLTQHAMNMVSRNTGLIIILFATLHILVSIIIDMNLKYFTTEGFFGSCSERSRMKKEATKSEKKKDKKINEKTEKTENNEKNMYKLSLQ